MTLHDRYARVTPYELAVPGRVFADERFTAIREEAEARGADVWDPSAFVMLAQVGGVVRAIRGEEDDPALIHQYGMLLYHAYHFWRSGETVYLVDRSAARGLVRGGLAGSTDGGVADPPIPSAYCQLPHRLFWARPDPDAPAESIDGFFWVATPTGHVHVLVALGMHDARPGLSVIPVPGAELADASDWLTDGAREEGPDFQSTLPGSELDELYSLETHGEALKLFARLLQHLAAGRDSVGEPQRAPKTDDPAQRPLPSSLSYRIVSDRPGPQEAP